MWTFLLITKTTRFVLPKNNEYIIRNTRPKKDLQRNKKVGRERFLSDELFENLQARLYILAEVLQLRFLKINLRHNINRNYATYFVLKITNKNFNFKDIQVIKRKILHREVSMKKSNSNC